MLDNANKNNYQSTYQSLQTYSLFTTDLTNFVKSFESFEWVDDVFTLLSGGII